MLWLSETHNGYDTICDYDGKICSAVKFEGTHYRIAKPEECKTHQSLKKKVENTKP